MKILIVEDDPIIQEGLRISLGQEGYELTAASCVKEALELIKTQGSFDAAGRHRLRCMPGGEGA